MRVFDNERNALNVQNVVRSMIVEIAEMLALVRSMISRVLICPAVNGMLRRSQRMTVVGCILCHGGVFGFFWWNQSTVSTISLNNCAKCSFPNKEVEIASLMASSTEQCEAGERELTITSNKTNSRCFNIFAIKMKLLSRAVPRNPLKEFQDLPNLVSFSPGPSFPDNLVPTSNRHT